jgi:hypothetical protein
VSVSEILTLVIGTVQGIGGIAILLVALFFGVCVGLTLTKFRPTRNSLTIRSLDELVGPPLKYLPPDAPRGPSDQLRGSRRTG